MAATILVRIVMLGAFAAAVFGTFVVWLWRRKSRKDAGDYQRITGTSEVKTIYNLEQYTRSLQDKKKR